MGDLNQEFKEMQQREKEPEGKGHDFEINKRGIFKSYSLSLYFSGFSVAH